MAEEITLENLFKREKTYIDHVFEVEEKSFEKYVSSVYRAQNRSQLDIEKSLEHLRAGKMPFFNTPNKVEDEEMSKAYRNRHAEYSHSFLFLIAPLSTSKIKLCDFELSCEKLTDVFGNMSLQEGTVSQFRGTKHHHDPISSFERILYAEFGDTSSFDIIEIEESLLKTEEGQHDKPLNGGSIRFKVTKTDADDKIKVRFTDISYTLSLEQDKHKRIMECNEFFKLYKSHFKDIDKTIKEVQTIEDIKREVKKFATQANKSSIAYIVFVGHGSDEGMIVLEKGSVPGSNFIKEARKIELYMIGEETVTKAEEKGKAKEWTEEENEPVEGAIQEQCAKEFNEKIKIVGAHCFSHLSLYPLLGDKISYVNLTTKDTPVTTSWVGFHIRSLSIYGHNGLVKTYVRLSSSCNQELNQYAKDDIANYKMKDTNNETDTSGMTEQME